MSRRAWPPRSPSSTPRWPTAPCRWPARSPCTSRYRRDEYGVEPAKLLRLAAEAEWEGKPPEVVVDWLADRDIKL